jgi:hypothetical protein
MKKTFMGGAATALALCLVAGNASPAFAAEPETVRGAITNISLDKTEAYAAEKVRLNFDFKIPESADAGDQFSLTLPAEQATRGTQAVSLKAPNEEVLATAKWNGKTLVFTLNEYVDENVDVAGSGFVTVGWDSAVPNDEKNYDLIYNLNDGDTLTTALTYLPYSEGTPIDGFERPAGKQGLFSNRETEGADSPVRALSWALGLPATEKGYPDGVVVTDTPQAGSTLNCEPRDVFATSPLIATVVTIDGLNTFPEDRYTYTCEADKLVITVPFVQTGEFIGFSIDGDITDASLPEYKNDAVIAFAGTSDTHTGIVTRSNNGGEGNGNQYVEVGDTVFSDSNSNAIQDEGEAGIAGVPLTLTVTNDPNQDPSLGSPTVGTVTDENGHYIFSNLPALATGDYTVTVGEVEGLVNTNGNSASTSNVRSNGITELALDFGLVAAAPPVEVPPVVTEPPVVVEPPVAVEPPVVVTPPVVTEPPVVVEPPVVTAPPVVVTPPVVTEPPVVEEVVPPAVVEASPEAPNELAETGVDGKPLGIIGGLILLLGGVFIAVGRLGRNFA